MSGHGNRDVGPKHAGFLPLPHHALDEIKILYQEVMRKLAQELETVPQLSLKNDGQVAFGAQTFQMEKGHLPQFFSGFRYLLQSGPRPLDEPVKGGINGRHQQLVFILEVEVDGAVSYAGPVGDLGHPGVEKPMLGDDFNGRIQDALVFVRSPIHGFGSRL